MEIIRRIVVFLAFISTFALTSGSAGAQNADQDFYKNKVVRFLVGYGSGGYDTLARMIAPYLEKNIGTTVVVENQPGAGGIVALSRLYHAPPDGLLLMILNGPSAALQQLVEPDLARHDLAKFNYLGTVSAAPLVWVVAADYPYHSVAEIAKSGKPVMWPATGAIDALGDSAAFTCAATKLNCKIISGYGGSGDAALAVSRGEMDGIYLSDFQANTLVKSGQFRAFATLSRKRSPFFPDTPTVFEAAPDMAPEQQWLFDFRAGVQELGRLLIAPPDMPEGRLAVLRAAVQRTLTDPTLVADGDRTQNPIAFRDADTTTQSMLAAVANITPEQKARVKSLLAYQ